MSSNADGNRQTAQMGDMAEVDGWAGGSVSAHLPEGQVCAAPTVLLPLIAKSEAKLMAGQAKYICKPDVAQVLPAVSLHPLSPLSLSPSLSDADASHSRHTG